MRTFAIGILTALAVALAADFPLIQPKELSGRIQAKGARPALIHVGFNVLYRSKHIPNSVYAGPASTPEGLAALRAAAGKLPRDCEIVVYCGCCPWDHCPNIKPAMELLKQMGFTRVQALYVPANMDADWFSRGYPSELGEAAKPAK
jgi:rhodanese-related sulfurtransferase